MNPVLRPSGPLLHWVCRTDLRWRCAALSSLRHASASHGVDIKRTRNIGIIAHIDAGKTTTTERMLYYSGHTRRIGDVDDGSTVTDFLPAERARGITIQSAAVTFQWPPGNMSNSKSPRRSEVAHTINLIDTPGHADFTFEVLRSLRILDGAVCVLDGVAGVEAQTEKVWSQANKYSIPRIIFVNKLDREGAAFARTVKEIGQRLRGLPAVCHIPWWEGGRGRFTGIGDAINLCALMYDVGSDGSDVQRLSLDQLQRIQPPLVDEIKRARRALVESLCEFDEQLLETWLEQDDDGLAISAQDIWDSLRRCTIEGTGKLIPVFAGASFRNIGVQPLLDAVNNLLPDPTERPDAEISLNGIESTLPDLLAGRTQLDGSSDRGNKNAKTKSLHAVLEGCALAFKVVNDATRGTLVYFRVYSGTIKRNAPLWNTNLHVVERAQRLFRMYANDAVEIDEIASGQIGVIAGLKHARTGDTLISCPGSNIKNGPPGPLANLQLRPIDVPPPVFFAAIEPHSLSEERNVAAILELLLREDPSLHVNIDDESGQMHLSGMGELHLEIARDRLIKDFKAKATMGSIEIGYRESVSKTSGLHYALFDRDIAGRKGKAGCTVSLAPLEGTLTTGATMRDGNAILIDIKVGVVANNEVVGTESSVIVAQDVGDAIIRDALINGIMAALARGPRRAFPMHSTTVQATFSMTDDFFGTESTPTAISSAARLATQTALKELWDDESIVLMEPVMNVIITCDEASLGAIVQDLSAVRGGHVLSLGDDNAEEDETGDQALLPAIDARRIYTPPDPFASSDTASYSGPGQQRNVVARVPLKEMVGYLKHLRSMTGGRGTFVMSVDRFERLSGSRERAV